MGDFKFGDKSQAKLATVHPLLAECAEVALIRSPYDFTIVHGWRGEDVQNALFDSGASRKRFPDSRHNQTLDLNLEEFFRMQRSDAIDFAPWIRGSIPWSDTHIFAVIAGCFFAAADELDITLRWGGDWDSDGDTTDQTLMDWGHVEIMHGKAYSASSRT